MLTSIHGNSCLLMLLVIVEALECVVEICSTKCLIALQCVVLTHIVLILLALFEIAVLLFFGFIVLNYLSVF